MKQPLSLSRQFILVIIAALLLVTSISTLHEQVALADYTHNPHGVINYCSLSLGKTMIYGWGHDPDAPKGGNPTVTITAGGQSATVKTSIDNYHESLINKYLNTNWPNVPTSGMYGFVASFTNLYQGTSYSVSGVVHNYGSGTGDNALKTNNTSISRDGINPNYQLNANNTLPDACLNPKPTPPPATTPTPSPTPAPTPSSTPTHTTSSTGATHTSIAATTTPTTAADAIVSIGTLTAEINVPADGASTVAIAYGTTAATLDYVTDPTTVTGGSAIIDLGDLTPKTDYFYQIIRTDVAGKVTNSAQATFTTAGFVAKLHFIDAKGKPVGGIAGAIDDTNRTTAKSDKNGDIYFTDLTDGQYKATFRYGQLNYTRDFNTDTAGDGRDNPGRAITLNEIVNVSKLTGGSSAGYTGPTHHSKWPIILLVLFLLGAGAGAFVWFRRRRAGTASHGFTPPHGDYALATLPTATSSLPPQKLPKKVKIKAEPPGVQLQHVGESLPDMVMKAMHEEAARRKAQSK